MDTTVTPTQADRVEATKVPLWVRYIRNCHSGVHSALARHDAHGAERRVAEGPDWRAP